MTSKRVDRGLWEQDILQSYFWLFFLLVENEVDDCVISLNYNIFSFLSKKSELAIGN